MRNTALAEIANQNHEPRAGYLNAVLSQMEKSRKKKGGRVRYTLESSRCSPWKKMAQNVQGTSG